MIVTHFTAMASLGDSNKDYVSPNAIPILPILGANSGSSPQLKKHIHFMSQGFLNMDASIVKLQRKR